MAVFGAAFGQRFTAKREFLIFPPLPAEKGVVVEPDPERADIADTADMRAHALFATTSPVQAS